MRRPTLNDHTVRHTGGIYLATRRAVAALTNRHPNCVRNTCQPIACQTETGLPLYDLMDCNKLLRDTPRRERLTRRAA